MNDSVSVLIVCFNEEEDILNLLQALENQTAKNKISEILIADNGSSDSTLKKINMFEKNSCLNISHWQRPENNIGAARKELVDRANSNWLAFIDADCIPSIDWLETLLSQAKRCSSQELFAGVGGHNRLPENNSFQVVLNSLLEGSFLHGFSSQAYSPDGEEGFLCDHLPTTNALMRKDAILSSGNFVSAFNRVGEDLDLGLKMISRGYKLYKFKDPVVLNESAKDLRDWICRMLRFGKAQGLVFGRRKNFVSLVLALTFFAIPLLIIFPKGFQLSLSIYLISCMGMVLMAHRSRPNPAIWLTGFMICLCTPLFYFLGFIHGLWARFTVRPITSCQIQSLKTHTQ